MSDSETMLERVARALCRCECEPPGIGYSVWDDSLSEIDRDKYRAQARAALEAMLEPEMDAIEAMQKVVNLDEEAGRFEFLSRYEITAIWQTGIGKALEG